MEGEFKKLAFERNENNTGPVHRAYAFSVSDTLWQQIKQHADLLPHSKYGTTEVFYLLNSTEAVSLQLKMGKAEIEDAPYIAYVKKDGMGSLTIKRFPTR